MARIEVNHLVKRFDPSQHDYKSRIHNQQLVYHLRQAGTHHQQFHEHAKEARVRDTVARMALRPRFEFLTDASPLPHGRPGWTQADYSTDEMWQSKAHKAHMVGHIECAHMHRHQATAHARQQDPDRARVHKSAALAYDAKKQAYLSEARLYEHRGKDARQKKSEKQATKMQKKVEHHVYKVQDVHRLEGREGRPFATRVVPQNPQQSPSNVQSALQH